MVSELRFGLAVGCSYAVYVLEVSSGERMKCPDCGSDATKAIYFGIPLNLCLNEDECFLCWGAWSALMNYLPYNGYLMFYEGPYIKALWRWLTK